MQISRNTTRMSAGISVAMDKEGRDFCVVVVKGTFTVGLDGNTRLADQQCPMVFADQHCGAPETSSICYESDFAPQKPRAEVLVVGKAMAPLGKPVRQLFVALRSRTITKELLVTGNRHWSSGLFGIRATEPEPFVELAVQYERAFGGSDFTHPSTKRQGAELRNPVGTGFRLNDDVAALEGHPLPNLETPHSRLQRWNDKVPAVGLNGLGRSWQPRISHAGTYDQSWLEHRFPFLPDDFDPRYFQFAPEDQQLAQLSPGETFVCQNMSPGGSFVATIPQLQVPVLFRFLHADLRQEARLDTVVLEPDQQRMQLTWRARVALPKKLVALQEIEIGHRPPTIVPQWRNGKRHFRSLSELVLWRNQQKKGG